MPRTGAGLASVRVATSALALFVACNAPDSTDFYERLGATEGGGTGGTTALLPGPSGMNAGGDSGAPAGEAGQGGDAGDVTSAGTGGNGGSTAGAAGSSGFGGSAGTTPGAGGEGEGGHGGAPEGCALLDPTAVAFDGHCYALRAAPRDWPEARRDCEEHGAHLVTITSKERTREQFQAENDFVWQLTGEKPSWLGATDGKRPHDPGDGTYYTWIVGEPMTFDNWSDGNPNNSSTSCQDAQACSCDQGACYEHCGFQWMNPGKDGSLPGWNDRLCEHVLPYVCEWDHE